MNRGKKTYDQITQLRVAMSASWSGVAPLPKAVDRHCVWHE